MKKIGVVEGFFGPAWSHEARKSYAPFIQESGGGFYIYAPKRDPKLRKEWRHDWGQDYLAWLKDLAGHFLKHQVTFGVGLSPFGLGKILSKDDERILKAKLRDLSGAGVELLGFFFDDMPSDQNLLAAQLACVKLVRREFTGRIVFCPSYYTPDPILEKVFGKMPQNYWQDISTMPIDVFMAWTGPKVISTEISNEHLKDVTALLKRRPFIWENIFANDGPKNCKFLKLKPFSGRDKGVIGLVEAFAFNMMNQAQLSKVLFLSSRLVLEKNLESQIAFDQALNQLCSAPLKDFILQHREFYLQQGLDQMVPETKHAHIAQLSKLSEPMAHEIVAWLKGEYIVGPECLTD